MENSSDIISEQCTILNNYNGKLSREPYSIASYDKKTGYIVRERWTISGQGDLISSCEVLNSELDSISTILDKIYNMANDIEQSSQSISEIQNNMENNLENAFKTLETKIAYNQADAKNEQFIKKDNILTQYWIDKPLKFEKKDNGTYLIKQEDDKGNLVVMGFTTATAYNAYQNILNNNNFNNNLVEMEPNTENVTYTEIINQDGDTIRYYKKDGKIINKVKIDKDTGQMNQISENTTMVTNQDNNVSSTSINDSKTLVGEANYDNNTEFSITTSESGEYDSNGNPITSSNLDWQDSISPTLTTESLINNVQEHKDIRLAEGTTIEINGKSIPPLTKDVIYRYDSNSNKYQFLDSDGQITGPVFEEGYTIDELMTFKIVDITHTSNYSG